MDLADAYNRLWLKLLIDLLQQYGVSLTTLTRWIAGALHPCVQLGNRSSAPRSSTAVNGPTTRITALKPVLNNVYTKGVADLKQNGPCKVCTHTSR